MIWQQIYVIKTTDLAGAVETHRFPYFYSDRSDLQVGAGGFDAMDYVNPDLYARVEIFTTRPVRVTAKDAQSTGAV